MFFVKDGFVAYLENLLFMMAHDVDGYNSIQMNMAGTPRILFNIEQLKKQSLRLRIVSMIIEI